MRINRKFNLTYRLENHRQTIKNKLFQFQEVFGMKKSGYLSLLLLVTLLVTAFVPNGTALAADKGATTIEMYGPMGVILDRTPTFQWKRVTGFSYYDIKVVQYTTTKYIKTNVYCGTTYCEYTPVYTLDYKDYTWFITLHNGSYSTTNSLDFVVSSPSFSSGFNGSKAGWARYKNVGGIWNISSSVVWTKGYGNAWSPFYRQANGGKYNDFDYTVRVRRFGGTYNTKYPAHCLMARMGNYVSGVYYWYPGYRFCINNSGKYEIYYKGMSTADSHTIKPWTWTGAINSGNAAWNILRVRAVGENFWFYINGVLVKSFSDDAKDRGYVGVMMYKYAGSATQFDVDYAYLNVLETAAAADKAALAPAAKLPFSEDAVTGSR